MSTITYDRYGRRAGSVGPAEKAPDDYIIASPNATTNYICYYETGSDPRAIRRITKDTASGITQICVGWGAWSDRASLDYYPVNSIFVVDAETKALVSVSPVNTPVD